MPEYKINIKISGGQQYDGKRCFPACVNAFICIRNKIYYRERLSVRADAFPKPGLRLRRRRLYALLSAAAYLILVTAAAALSGCGDKNEAEFFSFAEQESAEKENASGGADGEPEVGAVGTETAEAPESEAVDEKKAELHNPPAVLCVIHICGAVNRPGVYELPEDSRVMDAVTAGGGFTPDAAADACNLAAHISDGSRIYILTKKELEEQAKRPSGGKSDREARPESGMTVTADAADMAEHSAEAGPEEQDLKVNINTADAAALMTLPGIGESRAEAVIAYRNAHGGFQRIEDIMKVSGIKQAAFAKIRDRIKV